MTFPSSAKSTTQIPSRHLSCLPHCVCENVISELVRFKNTFVLPRFEYEIPEVFDFIHIYRGEHTLTSHLRNIVILQRPSNKVKIGFHDDILCSVLLLNHYLLSCNPLQLLFRWTKLYDEHKQSELEHIIIMVYS